MLIEKFEIPGVFLLTPQIYQDERGKFFETYRHSFFNGLETPLVFVQENRSLSKKNVLRGLHYQIKKSQGKLITVLNGSIFDVAVDLRPHSPTYKQWITIELSAQNPQQFYLPPGIAHGFYALEENSEILYKCTDYYDAQDEGGLLWNDTALNIPWPTKNPILNKRDQEFPRLSEITPDQLPQI